MSKSAIIVGQREVGKSTLLKDLISGLNNRYIFDINREHVELNNFAKGIELDDINAFFNRVKDVRNSTIVFEEATTLFKYRSTMEVTKLLVQSSTRHKNNNIFFVFHGLIYVPDDILTLCNYMFLKRTKGNPTSVLRKYDNYPEITEAYERLKNNPNFYDFEIIEL
jgi:AAA+ ATPase superfamily predicted ATPase